MHVKVQQSNDGSPVALLDFKTRRELNTASGHWYLVFEGIDLDDFAPWCNTLGSVMMYDKMAGSRQLILALDVILLLPAFVKAVRYAREMENWHRYGVNRAISARVQIHKKLLPRAGNRMS